MLRRDRQFDDIEGVEEVARRHLRPEEGGDEVRPPLAWTRGDAIDVAGEHASAREGDDAREAGDGCVFPDLSPGPELPPDPGMERLAGVDPGRRGGREPIRAGAYGLP